MRQIGREPIFIERGEGCELIDVDGNRYVDWVCSWGPLILGHADPEVVEAVREAAGRGTSFGAPTAAEVELATEVTERFASVEMVRMTSSGTEASMSAIRLARAVTGRERVIKFAGAYHGHVDGLLAEAGSGMATAGVPASPGVTEAQAAGTVIVPWNDFEAIARAVDEHRPAAIIAEPLPANMGVVPPAEGFLERLRELADASGAVLILDEVISGFRVARGGAQERLGVMPDLTVLGKIVGGGLPLAAFGGRAEVMSELAPSGSVYQAGTLSGNPIATAAGLSVLRRLRDADVYDELERRSARLADGLAPFGRVQRVGAMLTLFAGRDEPVGLRGCPLVGQDGRPGEGSGYDAHRAKKPNRRRHRTQSERRGDGRAHGEPGAGESRGGASGRQSRDLAQPAWRLSQEHRTAPGFLQPPGQAFHG